MTLVEAIKRYIDNAEYERTHGNLQGCLEFKQLAEWLKELKQLREHTRWIPVNERLPEESEMYLVAINRLGYPLRAVDGFTRGKWERFGDNVIAWCKIPEPYEAENEDKKMTKEEIDCMKYKVCCPMCDNEKCVKGTDKCEVEIWAKEKEADDEQATSEEKAKEAD